MDNKKIQYYFLFILLSGAAVLTFFILRPFLHAIILAGVLAVIFEPVHQKMLYTLGNRPRLAAFVTTVTVVIAILVPCIVFGIKVFGEVEQAYFFLIGDQGKDIFGNIAQGFMSNFQKYVPFGQALSANFEQYLQQWLLWLLQYFGYLFGSVAKLIFDFVIFILVIYYLFCEGPKIKKLVFSLSPFPDDSDEIIFTKIKTTIHSVIKGSLIIAFIQGILTAVGFIIFGVPNPVLWGIAATIAALIPGVGTGIVSIPAIVFLYLQGNLWVTFGLLVWSFLVVGLVDNIIRPILVGRQIKIHPLIIFLSVIGGILFFGPIGFLLGPLTISLLFAFFDTYLSLKRAPS